jgi:alpha-glucosidase (family GH31 glycosyl hydrolase)
LIFLLIPVLWLLAPAACASQPVTLLSHARHGNRAELRLSYGSAELEWITPSTFRLSRWWGSRLESPGSKEHPPVAWASTDSSQEVVFRTEYLHVNIRRAGLLITVTGTQGVPLMTDATEIENDGGVFRWERNAPAGTRYYGLGARVDNNLNARGKRVLTRDPFLIASRGYAEQYVGEALYTFDLGQTNPDRYGVRISGTDHVAYYFHFGPSLKEIFEQRLTVAGFPRRLTAGDLGDVTRLAPAVNLLPTVDERRIRAGWPDLSASLHKLVHGSLSGTLLGEFDFAPFLGSQPGLYARALELGSLVPVLRGAVSTSLRRKLIPYLLTYSEEARERGYPVIRSLPFQFPRDPEVDKRADEFMLGDELLAAPICTAHDDRTVYLPQGIWTNLATNEVFSGRQTIRLGADAEGPPLFVRNGSIMPLASESGAAGLMELHYFPKSSGEFFIFESDIEDYSQVHAAPAGDYLRLQIEPKKTRDYEWIVHHTNRPSHVSSGSWRYDAQRRNLHVRCRAQAGEDYIVNVAFD